MSMTEAKQLEKNDSRDNGLLTHVHPHGQRLGHQGK